MFGDGDICVLIAHSISLGSSVCFIVQPEGIWNFARAMFFSGIVLHTNANEAFFTRKIWSVPSCWCGFWFCCFHSLAFVSGKKVAPLGGDHTVYLVSYCHIWYSILFFVEINKFLKTSLPPLISVFTNAVAKRHKFKNRKTKLLLRVLTKFMVFEKPWSVWNFYAGGVFSSEWVRMGLLPTKILSLCSCFPIRFVLKIFLSLSAESLSRIPVCFVNGESSCGV